MGVANVKIQNFETRETPRTQDSSVINSPHILARKFYQRFFESAMMKTKTIVKVSTISIDIEASRNNTNMPQSAGTINIVIKTKVK